MNKKIKIFHMKKEVFNFNQLGNKVLQQLVFYSNHIYFIGLNKKLKYAYLQKNF